MKRERMINIELLRIISMLMVIVLHMNYHGGLLDSAEKLSRALLALSEKIKGVAEQ